QLALGRLRPAPGLPELVSKLLGLGLGPLTALVLARELATREHECLGERVDLRREHGELSGKVSFGHERDRFCLESKTPPFPFEPPGPVASVPALRLPRDKGRMLKPVCAAAVTLAACAVGGAVSASPATAARAMLVGTYDGVQPVDSPDTTFPILDDLRVQVIRLDLRWSDIARTQPEHPTDPADPAYDWNGFDETVINAEKNKIRVLFT